MEKQHKDFMVGWVCTALTERLAAGAMLDEEYNSLPYDARDSNAYKLGRIGVHNVVMASSPLGYYGTTAAAVVLRDMLWSFPSIKVVLLVGIGGGVPSLAQDVRLGDVVVSVPSSTSSGFIQYDSGKAHLQGTVQRTGILSQPPPVLLEAVSRLRFEHAIDEPELGRCVLETLIRNSRLRPAFSFPGHDRDLLFEAAYTHPWTERDCSSCDPSRLVQRRERQSAIPEVHYGSIASGNKVIKDAVARDQISHELGALCFEMGAAGLMDGLPCLVIRGIADYSDSHKNKEWQGYAALTAAAYAKVLLHFVPEQDLKTNVAASEVLSSFVTDRPECDPDISDTSSEASTLIGDYEPGVLETSIDKVADVLATDENVRVLCTAAALRIAPYMLQFNLVVALTVLSKTLRKLAQTPTESALRWLFSRHKSQIATRITERIGRQEPVAISLGLSMEGTPSIPDGHLMQILEDRLPGARAPSAPLNPDRAREEDFTINPEELPTQDVEDDFDPGTQEPPESATLENLSELDQILCRGPVFEVMYEKLKMLLLPPVPRLIEATLSRHLTVTAQNSMVSCFIEWELLQYFKHENLDVHDIEFTFTLNGEFDCACAIPVGEYMSATWESGKELLEAVKASVAAAFNNGTYRCRSCTHLSRSPTVVIRLI